MVHQKVAEAYQKAGYEYKKNSYDQVEERFLAWIGNNPVTRKINHITRVKVNKKEGATEYYYYGQVLSAQDSWKNNRELSNDTVGKYEFPTFRYEYNPQTQQTNAVEIERTTTNYELEYSEEAIEKLLPDFSESIKFYVRFGSKRYPVTSFDDFIDGSYEELIELGRSGKTSLAEIRTEQQNKEAEIRQKERMERRAKAGLDVPDDNKPIPSSGLNERLAKLQEKKVTVSVSDEKERAAATTKTR